MTAMAYAPTVIKLACAKLISRMMPKIMATPNAYRANRLPR